MVVQVLLLLGVFFYIFVVLSRYLFQPMPLGEKNAYKFSSFSLSFCTLFQLLTLDQWFDIETAILPPRRDQEAPVASIVAHTCRSRL